MPVLPNTIALAVIPDGSLEVAVDHRNNYAAVQAAVNKLIAITSDGNGVDGDAMVWDSVNLKWVPASTLAATRPRAARVVTSTMAGGPPGSPLDQDIWIATAVDANGTRWAFQYNAGSGSSLKWEFIGGAPVISDVPTNENTASAAYVDLATVQSFTLARAGDYIFDFYCENYNTAGASTQGMGLHFGAGLNDDVTMTHVNANTPAFIARKKKATVSAATVAAIKYKTSAGNAQFLERSFAIHPIRIA